MIKKKNNLFTNFKGNVNLNKNQLFKNNLGNNILKGDFIFEKNSQNINQNKNVAKNIDLKINLQNSGKKKKDLNHNFENIDQNKINENFNKNNIKENFNKNNNVENLKSDSFNFFDDDDEESNIILQKKNDYIKNNEINNIVNYQKEKVFNHENTILINNLGDNSINSILKNNLTNSFLKNNLENSILNKSGENNQNIGIKITINDIIFEEEQFKFEKLEIDKTTKIIQKNYYVEINQEFLINKNRDILAEKIFKKFEEMKIINHQKKVLINK